MKGQRFIVLLLVLTWFACGASVWASYSEVHASQRDQARELHASQVAQRREQQAAQRAGQAVERKLCTTFANLARRKPPPGNPKANPSRAYLQGQYATLNQIGPDLGCRKGGSR